MSARSWRKGGSGEQLLNGDRVFFCADENVLELDTGCCCRVLWMYQMPVSVHLKMVNYGMWISSQFLKNLCWFCFFSLPSVLRVPMICLCSYHWLFWLFPLGPEPWRDIPPREPSRSLFKITDGFSYKRNVWLLHSFSNIKIYILSFKKGKVLTPSHCLEITTTSSLGFFPHVYCLHWLLSSLGHSCPPWAGLSPSPPAGCTKTSSSQRGFPWPPGLKSQPCLHLYPSSLFVFYF